MNLESWLPRPLLLNPAKSHVARSPTIACTGTPGLLNSIQTSIMSHSLVLGVCTSSKICPWEDAPEEEVCSSLGSRLGPTGQGITASHLDQSDLEQVWRLWMGTYPWPHGLFALWEGHSQRGPVWRQRSGTLLPSLRASALCPSVCLPLTQHHRMEVSIDICPTMYSLQSIFTYNTLNQSSQSCKIAV